MPPMGWNPHTTYMRPTVMRGGMQGDPGIFGSIGRFLGGAISSVPVVGGLVGGGVTALANALDPVRPKTIPQTAPILPGMGPQFQQAMPVPGVKGAAQRFFPGGESGYQCEAGGKAPSGYHWNKADYFLRDGTFIPAGSKLVKNRRRNPANARATNRAISRVASAKKHAQTLSRVTIRKK